MAFLVSTNHHILLIDTDRRTAYQVHSGRGLYYGLCLYENGLIAACRNAVQSRDESARMRERGSLLFFNDQLELIGEAQPPFPLRDVHGIACFDGLVWITCSFDNLVAIFDLEARTWRKWYPSGDPAARGRDVHHLNTIVKVADRLLLLAHNMGPSHILTYCYPSLELESVRQLGFCAHNIFFVEGSLATCSSNEGLLVSESGWRLRTGRFPRGLATAGGITLLGLSGHARHDERSTLDGVVRVFDGKWVFQADYVLPSVGMVLDALPIGLDSRTLSSEELAHNEARRELAPDRDGSARRTLCAHLDPWPYMRIYDRQYNPEDPGNLYLPGQPRFSQPGDDSESWPEWHAAESEHRWTAARDAGMIVVINPGEHQLEVQAFSQCDKPYTVEVCLNGSPLGQLRFSCDGEASETFALNGQVPGPARLSFRVPCLWQPASAIAGSLDRRSMGVAVRSVRIF